MEIKRKIFHKLVTPEEALEKIVRYVRLKPLGVEKVSLERALGRVLAENVVAKVNSPPFDRSTVDGYAVRSIDVAGARENNPIRLKVVGKVEAGEIPKISVESGEAVEIATGAPIPPGADAVVMVEFTRKVCENIIEVFKSVSLGGNISQTASDVMIGEVIAYKGTVITPQIIGALAAVGVSRVLVFKKPKVAILSTGNELVKPGTPLSYGKIYDVNSYTLYSSVLEDGGDPEIIGILPDSYEKIKETLSYALKNYDVIITSGSTSAGIGDLMYRVLDELGSPGVIVHGLNVKPGKPTIIAIINNKLVFGLPGYPVSCLMNYNLIVKPIIRKLAGLRTKKTSVVKAVLPFRVFGEKGRRTFVPVALIRRGKLIAFPVGGDSGSIARLTRSDGFIVVPENTSFLEENSEVNVYLFSENYGSDLEVIGSHCPVLEKILDKLRNKFSVRMLNIGSLGGLLAIKRGEADIAGLHLLDPETAQYNIPFIRKYNVKNAVLVKGYFREQGIIIPKGNPHKIRGFEDIIDKNVRFINRNKGSGTRVLIDILISKIAEKRGVSAEDIKRRIDGYWIEAKTHFAVASAVKYGRADVGVSLRFIAEIYGLEFIPLREEEYDFLISLDALNEEPVKEFIEYLRSREFIEILNKTPGYRPKDGIGEIVRINL
ncbi:MAG: molybdopterin biosynthesis protein [Thermoprotei archaeon]|nr:molybdopterin biosynthesis protein [Thermoprotei archaeon]